MKEYDYCERLELLKITSAERRRERYIIIYMFKILKQIVPNPGISWTENERTGIKAKLPVRNNKAPTYVKNLRESYFTMTGPKLFNSMPIEVRNFESEGQNKVLAFKNNLDKYLSLIPDQPHIQGVRRAAASNSITDQIFYKRTSNLSWSFCS